MTYDLQDGNYKTPATILEVLKQEYPKPSEFMNAYSGLLSETRKEQEERKQRFLNLVSQTLNLTTEEVMQKAHELFRESYERSERERIERMRRPRNRFLTTADGTIHTVEPFSEKEIEEELESLPSRTEKAVQEATDWDTLGALRMNVDGPGIEAAWKEWEDASGFANALEYEIVNWPDSALPVNSVPAPIEPETPPEEPVQFTRSVENGFLVRKGSQYIAPMGFPMVLKFLQAQNLPYNASIFFDRILKTDGTPFKESTIRENCKDSDTW